MENTPHRNVQPDIFQKKLPMPPEMLQKSNTRRAAEQFGRPENSRRRGHRGGCLRGTEHSTVARSPSPSRSLLWYTAKGVASFRLLRDIFASFCSKVLVFLERRREAQAIVKEDRPRRARKETERKRNAGQSQEGLTSRRVALPCRLRAYVPCFPFFPWSNLLPSGPGARQAVGQPG
jgi:hypothetical protein